MSPVPAFFCCLALYGIGLAFLGVTGFLSWWTRPRHILDREGRQLYLRRWYILGKPYMEDGSSPFDAKGAMKRGARDSWWSRRGLGLYLHCIHQSDSEPELHNHPWRWAVALILRCGYMEERRESCSCGFVHCMSSVVHRRRVRPFTLNIIRSSDFHRVELVDGRPSWSLFLVGPRFQNWGFWNRVTGLFLPWREFIASRRPS